MLHPEIVLISEPVQDVFTVIGDNLHDASRVNLLLNLSASAQAHLFGKLQRVQLYRRSYYLESVGAPRVALELRYGTETQVTGGVLNLDHNLPVYQVSPCLTDSGVIQLASSGLHEIEISRVGGFDDGVSRVLHVPGSMAPLRLGQAARLRDRHTRWPLEASALCVRECFLPLVASAAQETSPGESDAVMEEDVPEVSTRAPSSKRPLPGPATDEGSRARRRHEDRPVA